MSTVIVGGTIFTGTGELLTNGSVLIDEGRIAAIGRDVRRPRDARVIDAAGQFVMAGFIDAHSHLALVDVPERPEPHPDTAFLAVRAAREKLASGVTAVRDLGGNNHTDLALRRAIGRGDVLGPRMQCAGKVVAATGGHIHYFAREADGPDEVRKAVREQIRAGADVIKLMLSGGGANVGERPDRMQLQPDEIRAAVLEANEAGRKVAAHAHPSRAIQAAAEAGITSVEHAGWLDHAAIEAVLRHNVSVIPTQAAYKRIADNVDNWPVEKAELSQRILAEKTPRLRRAFEAGVKIGVGTDSGRHFPSGDYATELQLLTEVGMSNEQVLLAATSGNAELMGLSGEIGTLEVGKRADLVLLGGDPLTDLEQVRNVRVVITGGRVYSPRTLLFGEEGSV